LIHVSELTHGYVKIASEVLKEGEEIEAKVLDVDRRKRQIRLSMKALQAEMVEEFKPEREERKGKGRNARAKRKKPTRWKRKFPTSRSTPPCRSPGRKLWRKPRDAARSAANPSRRILKSRKNCSATPLEKRLPTGG
jgi:predicted RNA-binding protein with RPS1 domain